MNAVIVERLGWTLVHSLWQFTALGLLLMLMLQALAAASPRARYACAAVFLFAMCGCLPVTFVLQSTVRGERSADGFDLRANEENEFPGFAGLDEPGGDSQRRYANIPSAAPNAVALARQAEIWRDRIREVIRPRLRLLVALWLLGAGLFSIRPFVGWRAVRRLRSVGASAVSPEIAAMAQSLARRLGIRHVELMQSTLVQVPAVVGWLRPLILLPVGVAHGLTPDQLQGVLAHELAHIRRHDYLVNFFQTLAETLLFYHPVIWWVSHQMRVERENCCDDVALGICPDRGQFARALLTLAEFHSGTPRPALAATGGSLLARIRRITRETPAPAPRSGGLAATTVVFVLLGTLIFPLGPASATRAELSAHQKPARESQPKSEAYPTVAETSTRGARHAADSEPTSLRGATEDPWFWPDPYSHLGRDVAAGDGWLYVRIAADPGAGEDLGTSDEQRHAIAKIFSDFTQRQRELGKELSAQGKVDAAAWATRRRELWLPARDAAKARLSKIQHRRVEQLMIQRKSYNAFRSQELIDQLKLSEDQHAKIIAAITAHLTRIRDEELELGHSLSQAADAKPDSKLAKHVRELKAAKEHRGRLSHRRVWDEIYNILTPAQRERFNRLRGPMAEPAAKMLPLFEGKS